LHFIIIRLSFLTYCSSSHGFSFAICAVNHLYNTLPSCTNFGCFGVCCLKRSSPLFLGHTMVRLAKSLPYKLVGCVFDS
jgi:hypothetical protein